MARCGRDRAGTQLTCFTSTKVQTHNEQELHQCAKSAGGREAAVGDEADDPNDADAPATAEDVARFRGKKKDSALENGVERFMLSFVGNASPLQQAMHVRNYG